MNEEKKDGQMTHMSACPELLGSVEMIKTGKYSRVSVKASEKMRVDERGLIHGGFAFGLADYAAMVAVNHPNVVLLSAQARFLKPVALGDTMTARAQVTNSEGKKSWVHCEVFNQTGQKVFESELVCLSLDRHVLER